jgi:hypothetical protein
MQKFQFFTASPLKMPACGTGRKFAEYDQRESSSLSNWIGAAPFLIVQSEALFTNLL